MKTILLNKIKYYNNILSDIFPEINPDIKEITIYGNCVNIFGFSKLSQNNENNLNRLKWLIKALQNNIKFIIIGKNEDKKYFIEISNNIYKLYKIKFIFTFITLNKNINLKKISNNSNYLFKCYIIKKKTTFKQLDIQNNDILICTYNNYKVNVVDNIKNKIKYNNEIYTMNSFLKKYMNPEDISKRTFKNIGNRFVIYGPNYFTYNNITISNLINNI